MLMFVKGPYLRQILRGEKTSTIRPWKTCTLAPGDVLMFNGRIRAVITRVVKCTLRDITEDQSRADGFDSRRAFREAFQTIYPDVTLDSPVVVLSFDPPANDSDQSATA